MGGTVIGFDSKKTVSFGPRSGFRRRAAERPEISGERGALCSRLDSNGKKERGKDSFFNGGRGSSIGRRTVRKGKNGGFYIEPFFAMGGGLGKGGPSLGKSSSLDDGAGSRGETFRSH
jgi:hypothetical protein